MKSHMVLSKYNVYILMLQILKSEFRRKRYIFTESSCITLQFEN